MNVDGFYSGYFAARNGDGFALFVFQDGMIVGSDPRGVTFDGTYSLSEAGTEFIGRIKVQAPGGGTLIQGLSTGIQGIAYDVDVILPVDFSSKPFVQIRTPLGPVNLRLVRLRGIDRNDI